jgi:sugar/nucleoside kinase (ribokinase family)
MGRYVKEPRISTGGGDNFNAGFCLGLLIGLSMEESMITAMANSGAYVQNGKSPSMNDLITYITQWQSEL